MRKTFPEKAERGRVRGGYLGSMPGETYGAFIIAGPCGCNLTIVASDGQDEIAAGWEHVSVSTPRRPPNWQEMGFVKDLFWESEECVLQFHPPEMLYVNNHPNCLHMWKPPFVVPLPPALLVGQKDAVIKSPEEAFALHQKIVDEIER